MATNNKQAKRRLKQLGAALDPSKAGWSDSDDEDLVKEGIKTNVRALIFYFLLKLL